MRVDFVSNSMEKSIIRVVNSFLMFQLIPFCLSGICAFIFGMCISDQCNFHMKGNIFRSKTAMNFYRKNNHVNTYNTSLWINIHRKCYHYKHTHLSSSHSLSLRRLSPQCIFWNEKSQSFNVANDKRQMYFFVKLVTSMTVCQSNKIIGTWHWQQHPICIYVKVIFSMELYGNP